MAAEASNNPIVFFDVTLGGEPLGRIKFALFAHLVPRTAENFRQFCTGETRSPTGQPLGYKGSKFHRIMKDFMIQGGDFLHGDGSGSTSIYGTKYFADENFVAKHDQVGLLSMANTGRDSNGCQFFVTTSVDATRHLDGKHVVFGKVVEGMEVVRMMENVRVGANKRPLQDVLIAQCGEM